MDIETMTQELADRFRVSVAGIHGKAIRSALQTIQHKTQEATLLQAIEKCDELSERPLSHYDWVQENAWDGACGKCADVLRALLDDVKHKAIP